MTGHIIIGTNARPNLYPLAGDDRRLTLLKRGCANSVVGLELAEELSTTTAREQHRALGPPKFLPRESFKVISLTLRLIFVLQGL